MAYNELFNDIDQKVSIVLKKIRESYIKRKAEFEQLNCRTQIPCNAKSNLLNRRIKLKRYRKAQYINRQYINESDKYE